MKPRLLYSCIILGTFAEVLEIVQEVIIGILIKNFSILHTLEIKLLPNILFLENLLELGPLRKKLNEN
jgi:hypothetical protein